MLKSARNGLIKASGISSLQFKLPFEYNTASPYTYASQSPIVSYTELSEPLGDPLGANFKEWLGIVNYSLGRFDFHG